MKAIKILLTVLLAVFLAVVTATAQDVAPVAPEGDYYKPAGDYYKPAGDYYPAGGYTSPGNDAGSGGYYRVPEPSTLALLGIGLAAGLGYRIYEEEKGLIEG